MKFHETEEVAGVPSAAECELVGIVLAGEPPGAAEVPLVRIGVDVAEELLPDGLVGVRHPGGLHAEIPERSRRRHDRRQRVVGDEPGQGHVLTHFDLAAEAVALDGARLVAEVVHDLVRGVPVLAVAGLRGGQLEGEQAEARRAVPSAVGAVGVDGAVRGHLHQQPPPEPLHAGIGQDPVVPEVLLAAGQEHEDRPRKIARVVLLHPAFRTSRR